MFMFSLTLPLALVVAFILYRPIPTSSNPVDAVLLFLRRKSLSFLPEPLHFMLALSIAAALLGLLHPLAFALLCALPLRCFCSVQNAQQIKGRLDSGIHAGSPEAYESDILSALQDMTLSFSREGLLPAVLMALFLPLRLSPGIGMFLLLQSLLPDAPLMELRTRLVSMTDRLLSGLLMLCCGVVGRLPVGITGQGPFPRLVSILKLDMAHREDHMPLSGDISQGALLLGVCLCLTVLVLTVLLLLLRV